MHVIYQAKDYDPKKVTKRYIKRYEEDKYRWCEVAEDRRFDVRQGFISAGELPVSIREAADASYKISVHYIEWPLDEAGA